jgi:hypothetical protein
MDSHSFLPTFLIIGAARSGTTTLYTALENHPQVFVSDPKEPCYFGLAEGKLDFKGPQSFLNRHGVNEWSAYQHLFANAAGYKAIGEASTLYLYSESAPQRIKDRLPNVKLIAVLRNPAERAYSNYVMNRRDGREDENDFVNALAREEERKHSGWEFGWYYKGLGFYHEQLSRYYALFPKDQIRVYLFDDLIDNAEQIIADAYRFVGVDETIRPASEIHANMSGIPKNEWLAKALTQQGGWIKQTVRSILPQAIRKNLFRKIKSGNLQKAPPLDRAVRNELIAMYRADILRLQTLVDRDLSAWLESKS